MLSAGSVAYLKEKCPQYERNRVLAPLVYQLSDRALLGSHALVDKR